MEKTEYSADKLGCLHVAGGDWRREVYPNIL